MRRPRKRVERRVARQVGLAQAHVPRAASRARAAAWRSTRRPPRRCDRAAARPATAARSSARSDRRTETRSPCRRCRCTPAHRGVRAGRGGARSRRACVRPGAGPRRRRARRAGSTALHAVAGPDRRCAVGGVRAVRNAASLRAAASGVYSSRSRSRSASARAVMGWMLKESAASFARRRGAVHVAHDGSHRPQCVEFVASPDPTPIYPEYVAMNRTSRWCLPSPLLRCSPRAASRSLRRPRPSRAAGARRRTRRRRRAAEGRLCLRQPGRRRRLDIAAQRRPARDGQGAGRQGEDELRREGAGGRRCRARDPRPRAAGQHPDLHDLVRFHEPDDQGRRGIPEHEVRARHRVQDGRQRQHLQRALL